jgi:hypothetical protein
MDLTLNTYGRVFVSTDLSKGFTYYNDMAVGGVDTTLPAKEHVYAFDSHNRVVKVAEIVDHVGDISSTLSGYVPVNAKSTLEKIINKKRTHIQVHFGRCSKPTDFDTFESALILKGVNLKTHNISDVTVLTPSRALVQENASIEVESSYRVFKPTFTVTFPYDGVTSFIELDCVNTEDCSLLNQNGDVWIAAYGDNTYFKFMYSIDNGLTWTIHPTNLILHDQFNINAAFITAKGKAYWSIISSSTLYLYSVDVDTILSGAQINPSLIYSDPLSSIWSLSATDKYLWCAGSAFGDTFDDSFAIRVKLSDHSVEILDTGDMFGTDDSATVVEAYNDNFVLFGGENATLALYENGTFSILDFDADPAAIVSDIKILSELHWVIATNKGVYLTLDGGITWTQTHVTNIRCMLSFYDEIYGYMVDKDGIYRTLNGGQSWYKLLSRSYDTVQSAVISPYDHNQLMTQDLWSITNGVV